MRRPKPAIARLSMIGDHGLDHTQQPALTPVGLAVKRPVDPPPARSQRRFPSLDGLRGAACLLVLLGHLWTIVPMSDLEKTGPLFGAFGSGSLGVCVFLVLGGFLVTRSLIADRAHEGAFRIRRFWFRRLVRLGSQLAPLLIVILVVSWIDRWDTWSSATTRRSVIAVSTFTFNWSLINHPLQSREDLGHLWYLSVEQQFYAVFVVVLLVMVRYRKTLIGLLGASVVAMFVWRAHVLDDGWWAASLKTTTRADGLALGAMAALLVPYARTRVRVARALALPCVGTLMIAILLTPQLGPYAYLQIQGIVFVLVTTLLILSIAIGRHPGGRAERLLSWAPLTLVGRLSFPLYLWHYPIFWASARWTSRLDWMPRAVGAVAILCVVVYIADRFIERPVNRRLGRARAAPPGPGVSLIAGS